MALKDLVVSRAALTEEAIEKIVSGRLHYDTEGKTLSLTPDGSRLPAKKKLLTYLVGLQGWPYVTDDTVPTDASPTELQEQLGLPGGTVRPMLMDLRDRHLLSSKNGRYSVRAGALHAITSELNGSGREGKAKPRSAPSKRNKETSTGASIGGAGRRAKSRKTGGQSALFTKWIEDGFFDQPRSHADVVKKFRQAGIVVSPTSMPQLFLKAVRDDQLVRDEANVSGRNVWVYRRPK
jgi:hypothetical protein